MLFMQTNWKLSSNLTFDLQQCTSMYVLRKAQKSVGRIKPSPQVVRLFEPYPRKRWTRGWCWLCALSAAGLCLSSLSTSCISLSLGGICLGPNTASSFNGHDKHAIWTALMSSWKFLLFWEYFLQCRSPGGSMLRSDNFSLLQASIVMIAEPSLPLLISSPQRLTAW